MGYRELRKALLAKLGISNQALHERAMRKRQTLPMSTQDAIAVIAHEKGLRIDKYLDADDLARVRGLVGMGRTGSDGGLLGSRPTKMTPYRKVEPPHREKQRVRRVGKEPAKKKVWVVHGRNMKVTKALFAFLRNLELQPQEFLKAIGATRQGSPYVGTILDAAFRDAAAVVVLLTPDDEARLRRPFQKADDPAYEKALTPQARPNVLFEAGMAFGKNARNTVVVQVGTVRPFSDVMGRHIVRLGNDTLSRQELAAKLRAAGCAVNTDGNDWLSEGDFTA